MGRNLRYFVITFFAVVIAAVGAIFMLTSCGEVHESDLVGLYALNKRPPVEVLELKSDGSYAHSYQERGLPEETGAGRWKLEPPQYDGQISLDNYQPLPKRNAKHYGGYYMLSPCRFLGSIRLVRDFDLDQFFEKQ